MKRSHSSSSSDDAPLKPVPRHPPGTRPTADATAPLYKLAAVVTAASTGVVDPETATRGAGGSQPVARPASPPPRAASPPPASAVLAAEKQLADNNALSHTWLQTARAAWHAKASAAATPAALAAALADLRAATAADAVDDGWEHRLLAGATTHADVAAAARQLVEGAGTARARSRAPSPEDRAPVDAASVATADRVAALEARIAWRERGLAAVAEAGRGMFEAVADGVAQRKDE